MPVPTWTILTVLVCAAATAAAQTDEQRSPAEGGPRPRLVIDHPHVDLGVVRQGGVYDFSYTVRNAGDADLFIQRIRSLCGCTVTEPRQPQHLRPGEFITLNASFDSKNRVGPQTKDIEVYSNDPASPSTRLTFSAVVEAIYQLRPNLQRVVFDDLRRGEVLERTLDLLAGRQGAELQIADLRFSKSGITHTAEPIIERGYNGYRLSFALDRDVPIGPFDAVAEITVRSGDEKAVFQLPFEGQVISNITVRPRFLMGIAAVRPGEPVAYGRINLRAVNRETPFHIRRVEAGQSLSSAVEEQQPGLEYSVVLTVAPNARKGPLGTSVLIFTDSDEQPVISIPVFVNVGSRVQVHPEVVSLRRERPDDPRSSQVVTLLADSQDFVIESVSSDDSVITVARAEDAGRPERRLILSVAADAPPGNHQATVQVFTNLPGASELQIRVFAEVLGQTGADS